MMQVIPTVCLIFPYCKWRDCKCHGMPVLSRSVIMQLISSRAFSTLSFPFIKSSSFLFLSNIKPSSFPLRLLSSSSTHYPLYYELIHYRPDPRHPHRLPNSYTSIVAAASGDGENSSSSGEAPGDTDPMDRAKRRYYRKRQRRLYGGSGSDSDSGRRSDFVELKPEIIDFPRLHAREQELYFHDAFALPWEKDKHYRMVYQLEKKFFPEQSFDKAFVDISEDSFQLHKKGKRTPNKDEGEKGDERALVFFDEKKEKGEERKDGGGDVSEKKVEEFFRSLKKVPKAQSRSDVAGEVIGEPFLSSRGTGLPAKWDGPSGTVVLVDKPKGWTSFTVCGKLRRLVKVQKVGHAGTLDPMATGLLIVCVGKATKLVERYQGMAKCYSGVFRLGEATSTWDADSLVIQREPWEHIKDQDIKKAAASFHGEIWQVPPMFSAIKVGGEKMYDKARRGEMLELSPRRITIFEFDIERSLNDRQNLIFRVSCSKGTYIRSLCADFGKALGSCAHLTALRRDSIGEYAADDAWSFQDLEDQIGKVYL
ncbi:H/ACA ribonucleoprotein complex subunit 4 [Dendrobium catenatum]|uniref:tRNA pseudouridine(55) synthase n=2 Tax=Dendrobium catenatum TaxID=906689 RepID=A0A2I0VQP5_9ASPA|nr:H/ACA ribonucleoprotein complex subunit 4 [Dendrobium catenatum]